MEEAIRQAEISGSKGEVPVGAVLIKENRILASCGNGPIGANDPTAHAEIQVLRKAAVEISNYRLPGTTLYVTLEPCLMCAGALIHARVSRVVFGAHDPKTGALVSKYSIGSDNLLNHSLEITGGILEEKCAAILKSFFSTRRKK